MHFHVYLEDKLSEDLVHICQATKMKRNAIVREALQMYVARWRRKEWPAVILAFEGIDDFPDFSAYRQGLPHDTRPSLLGED